MTTFFQNLSDGINRRVEILLFAMGFAMTFIVVIQVFARYIFNYSFTWFEAGLRDDDSVRRDRG